jgi:hypothetical protein
MRRWLIRVATLLAVTIAAVLIAGWVASEPRPTGTPGPEADALARRIEAAIDKAAWDEVGAVAWKSSHRYDHLWDRQRKLARVRWDDIEVLLDLGKEKALVLRGGVEVRGRERTTLIEKAHRRWNNDSFWLNPLAKMFDDGSERAIVKTKDGRDALLVSYGAGGFTPGDAYLWIVGEDDLPRAWKLWVSAFPIGGTEVSWSGWITLDNGARISTRHEGLIWVDIDDVRAASSLGGLEAYDPFAGLKK